MSTKNNNNDNELANNRKASFNYQILDTLEAGLELLGTEVKSCRAHHVSLAEGFVAFDGGQAWLREVNIAIYEQGNQFNHEPKRKRRLLLHAKEIRKLMVQVEREGLSVVPLKMYLKRGRIKVLLGLGKGKNSVDKRESEKKREVEKEIRRMTKI